MMGGFKLGVITDEISQNVEDASGSPNGTDWTDWSCVRSTASSFTGSATGGWMRLRHDPRCGSKRVRLVHAGV
ncbi:hypothetical protein CM49_02166 [Paenibacillus sp. P1XP2]|nr:hypothetical protein CM49_02166 [Paenibacillus sp. P1XP2]